MSFKTKLKYAFWGFAVVGFLSSLYLLWFMKFIIGGALLVFLLYKAHKKVVQVKEWWIDTSFKVRMEFANSEAYANERVKVFQQKLNKFKFWR